MLLLLTKVRTVKDKEITMKRPIAKICIRKSLEINTNCKSSKKVRQISSDYANFVSIYMNILKASF
jgi:hypothetical protein